MTSGFNGLGKKLIVNFNSTTTFFLSKCHQIFKLLNKWYFGSLFLGS